MKKLPQVLLFVIFIISCNTPKENTVKVTVAAEKDSINVVLNSWHKSAAEAKFKAYFKAMTDSSVFIGTDASENWTIAEFKSFSKPYFDRGNAWNFKPVNRHIYVNKQGDVAWFDELLDTWMGVCRGSGVLLKDENSEWKIEHYVLSVTIPNESVNEVIAVKKEKDSVFLNKLKLLN